MKHVDILILSLALLAARGAFGASSGILWQIGKPDNSYTEFALAGSYGSYSKEFPGGAAFEVGKGDAAKNWIYVQPGPDAKWAGEGDHPYEVIFDLDSQPRDLYAVKIDLVDVSTGPAPSLSVRINDNTENFDLQPGKSQPALADPAEGRAQSAKLYIPGGFLHMGRNVLNIRVSKGEYVLYDCITMYKCENEHAPQLLKNTTLNCPPLFKKNNEELRQVVSVRMDLYESQPSVQVRIYEEGGWDVEQTFADVLSGVRTLEVMIPPVDTARNAKVEITAGGQVYTEQTTLYPQKRWKLYLMPLAHFDHGYTNIQSRTLEIHRENNDRAMDWFAKYPDFVWNSENSMLADDYLANGTRKDEFLKWARAGRLGIQALYANPLSGICSGEELSAYLGYNDVLRNNYGIDSKLAVEDDVPSMVGTTPMVLQGHGVKYFAHRVNTIRGPFDEMFNKCPFYWESPDGSRVLSWITPDQTWCMEMTDEATPDSLDRTRRVVQDFLSKYVTRDDYPYDAILVFGAYLDNDVNREQLASVPQAWNKEYAYPQLVYSRGTEFFEYVEANYADKLKTYKGDGGVYWEDGAASSARETAITRAAKEKITTAEKLVSLCDPEFQLETRGTFADAWRSIILYDEHTWGAGGSVSDPKGEMTLAQWRVKKSFADNAAEFADGLLNKTMDQFCSKLSATEDSVVVFNSSGSPRSEFVDLTTEDGMRLALKADSVPSMGYQMLPLSRATKTVSQPAYGSTLENQYYLVDFNTSSGAVTSIYDKELKRELIEQSGYGANAYLYAQDGDFTSSINFTGIGLKDLRIENCKDAILTKSIQPGVQVMDIQCTAPMAKGLSVRVILYDNHKRIDFINKIDKIENLKKEAAYFAFPFAFKDPEIRIDIPNGVIRPETDQLPSACRDWYAVQNFMTISDSNAAVVWTALDSPLVTLQDISKAQWLKHLDIKNGTMFAYVMNNYWFTNYRAGQGGPLTFRFSMTSGRKISDADALAFGESVQSPMVCKIVKGSSGKSKSSRSFVAIDGDGVVLQALKPARFTNGTVLRLREMNGKDAAVRVRLDGIEFRNAYMGNLAEDKLQQLSVKNGVIEVPCKALGLTTIILER